MDLIDAAEFVKKHPGILLFFTIISAITGIGFFYLNQALMAISLFTLVIALFIALFLCISAITEIAYSLWEDEKKENERQYKKLKKLIKELKNR